MSDRSNLAAKIELLHSVGGTASVEKFAELIFANRQSVEDLAKNGGLLRFELGTQPWQYPLFQTHERAIVKGLPRVLMALRDRDNWSKLIFLTTYNDYLEGVISDEMGTNDITPIMALQAGFVESVLLAT